MNKEHQYVPGIYDIALGLITVLATFLMGMLDAFTYLTEDGTFISAQTGNLVMLSVKFFSGRYAEMLENLISFISYFSGAFISQAFAARSRGYEKRRYHRFLLLQTAFFVMFALFYPYVPDTLLVMLLGLLAGYVIDLFRKLGVISVNNGIMTGNTKNLASNLYVAVFKKDGKARASALLLAVTIAVFVLGAGMGTLLTRHSVQTVLWSFPAVTFIQLLLARYLMHKQQS
ncbi:MAG: DUF1275 domain-containing protein [Chryseobacterium sp.]|nr:MAG: DUF1275 domain-containing protein [Chryseobacterium sp.]